MSEIFAIGSDIPIKIKGLKDYQGNYINDAEVTGVLQDPKGVVVVGGEDIIFTYVQGTNGDYEAIIPATVVMRNNKPYELIITVTDGDKTLTLKVRRIAKVVQA